MKIDTKKSGNFNIDVEGVIFDVICEMIGIEKAMEIEFDFDNATYSNGFISAIENGKVPEFNKVDLSGEAKKQGEYHHAKVNDMCYSVYFKN